MRAVGPSNHFAMACVVSDPDACHTSPVASREKHRLARQAELTGGGAKWSSDGIF